MSETKSENQNVDPEEEVARNRNTLLSYFNDIASIPTLTKEEEVMLAKEMESATFEMRGGILAVPFTWRQAVQIWRGLQAENRVTAKMSEAYGSGTPDGEERGERLDKALKRVEMALARYDQCLAEKAPREKADRAFGLAPLAGWRARWARSPRAKVITTRGFGRAACGGPIPQNAVSAFESPSWGQG